MFRDSLGRLGIQKNSSGSPDVNFAGGTLSQSTWHHIAICKIGAETGGYVDGIQIGYDSTFTPDTFAGHLYFGARGDGSNWFDGRMQDWAIVNQNIFNAAPNNTPDDDITAYLDTLNPLNLVA
jgi:hypothetical protein